MVIEDVVRRQAGFKTRHIAFNAVQVGAIAAELPGHCLHPGPESVGPVVILFQNVAIMDRAG